MQLNNLKYSNRQIFFNHTYYKNLVDIDKMEYRLWLNVISEKNNKGIIGNKY